MTKLIARAACLALGLITIPAAAETVTIWGKQAEVLSRTTSGRAGYDAVRVRWQDGQTSYVLEPRRVRAFVLNPQGGVNGCDLTANSYATDLMARWCAGTTDDRRADPSKFDCANAEVDSEYRFCGKPFPRRAR